MGWRDMNLGKKRELVFTVFGDPKSKNTGKIVTNNGFHKIVQPRETTIFQNLVRMTFKQKHMSHVCTNKAVRIDIKAFFKPTKAIMNSVKKLQLIQNDDYPYHKKPDKDRLETTVYDALKGVAFRDDTLIIAGDTEKFYSVEPRIEVMITIYDELELI
jgi:Holliday junction resolvase RusA-like endonuclease